MSSSLNIFQMNMITTGKMLAAEIPSSLPELRAFVVIGAYLQIESGAASLSKFLNANQEYLLRFWIRRYEVKREDIDRWITYNDLIYEIYLRDIQNIEQLEQELGKYLQDVSLLQPSWKVDNPLP